MGNYSGRRRDFPAGTKTVRLWITASEDEARALEKQAAELDCSVSELVVGRALDARSGLSPADVAMACVELLAARQELARGRLERREKPADRDELDAYLARASDELVDIAGRLKR